VSAILFAYDPKHHAMARETVADVAVNSRIDELTERGIVVSVHWLDPDASPSADDLLAGLGAIGLDAR
jgi:hypothetical protein